MSRIGKNPIPIPDKVKVQVQGNHITVEGPKGKLAMDKDARMNIEIKDNVLTVIRPSDNRRDRSFHGLTRSLIANMVKGVHEGFSKQLEIQGVGFRAAVKGKFLDVSVGKSHPINHPIPEGIKITVEDNTKVTVEGIDKQLVGAVAADIRAYYPPEPYKGKGIRYKNEYVIRKEGKTAQGK